MQINSSQNYSPSPLYRFYDPVKEALESHVKDCGHSASQLEPIINCAIDEVIRLNSNVSLNIDRILRQKIESSSQIYVDGVLKQTKAWRSCREVIKAYSSVFLVGSGLSYESDLPLADILNVLLNFCGISGVNNWNELRKDSGKFLSFKTQFKTLCDRKSPGNSHKLIIKNFPEHIYEIVCLNWDDLFEKAARLMGASINKQNEDKPATSERYLWKFHGDVENIKNDNVKGQGGWVLPDEDGFVFDSFQEYLDRTQLNKEPFSFIIVGYSEEEKAIYDEIVSLLEKDPPRPTYRIGIALKNLNKDKHIVGTAEFILPKILPISSITAS